MGECLSWLHVGDLHARAEDGWTGVERLRAVLADVAPVDRARALDFIYFPGDNANEGEPEQYARIRDVVQAARLATPLRITTGDHDFVPGDVEAFRAFLRDVGAPELPASIKAAGRRALFLDIVSGGGGGPAFALPPADRMWLERELIEGSKDDRYGPVVFMHAFPHDLAVDGDRIAAAFSRAGVTLVDTGHTHYNEIINDGSVVYTAARSTAQIEEEGENAFGAAFVAVDGEDASFRFRRTGSGWPFVMITSPADQRLRTRRPRLDDGGRLTVRAKVFGADRDAEVTLDALGSQMPMRPVADESSLWSATFPEPWDATVEALAPPDKLIRLTVRARSNDGEASDTIAIRPKLGVPPAGPAGMPGGSIGAWPEHGILGTRLGPNAFGRDW